jgi:hypothetical protein
MNLYVFKSSGNNYHCEYQLDGLQPGFEVIWDGSFQKINP